ncbi:MAG: M2 family metallopeptidase [Sedimentisphaerales bacterium]|nr:M2 family metallopeptidase [Sedimentisphaerales bacterium]
MNQTTILSAIVITCLIFSGCAAQVRQEQLDHFIHVHADKVRPLAKQASLASWDAAVSGKAEDYDRTSELSLKIRWIYSNPHDFEFLSDAKKSSLIVDPVLRRQLNVLYNAYLSNQIEPELLKEINDLGVEIEKNFSVFRGTIDGDKVTDSRIKHILKTETNSAERKKAWLASKQVGPVVAGDIIRLVKLRNKAARKLGFDNYHTMSLATGEQDVEDIDKVFDELYKLTNLPFAQLKADLDKILAANCNIGVAELMPWHYHDPFFQETPLVYEIDLDSYYKDKDIKDISVKFYASIGLPVESIIEKSDLYERDGKNPHAFCTDIDKAGDVRILCNLKNNETWMETQLHELGHAVYDKFHDPQVPWLLREPVHPFTTEAVAMFFGRLSRNPAWMQKMLDLSDEQRADIEKVADKYARLKQLIFARWAMVMYSFEKQLYADPDQDLNALWWKTVEKYQFVRMPSGRDEPDWAAKIHFAIAPCYYHNYMLGELLASQLHNHIVTRVLGLQSDEGVSYVGEKQAGTFLKEKVFHAGSLYHWNEMIRRATAEPLNPEYFVRQFVK